MTIKVVLYGKLKSHADKIDETTGSIGTVELKKDDLGRISDILRHLKIDPEEVSHIFLNRDYSHPEREIRDGDRVALFPKDMALLYKWYFKRKK